MKTHVVDVARAENRRIPTSCMCVHWLDATTLAC
jgi:hypothetical protein